jgi:hypothetical protein
MVKRMIRGTHVMLTETASDTVEPSIWLHAFLQSEPPSLSIIKELLGMGCDMKETAVNLPTVLNGWNSLSFWQVLRARRPGLSHEFKMLRFFIKQRTNLFAKDAYGKTISDHVNAAREWSPTCYQQDLWYCALQRKGIDTAQATEAHPRVAKYGRSYTPEHYRALSYFDSWTDDNLSRQVHNTLDACPWTDEEVYESSRIGDKRRKKIEKLRNFGM